MPNASPSNCGVEAWYDSPARLSTGKSMNKGSMRRKKTAERDNAAFNSVADMDVEFIILEVILDRVRKTIYISRLPLE